MQPTELSSSAGPPFATAPAVLELAEASRWRAPEVTVALAEQAVQLSRAAGDHATALRAEGWLALGLVSVGRGLAALPRAARALAEADQRGRADAGDRLRVALGTVAVELRDPKTALALLRPVLGRTDGPDDIRADAHVAAVACENTVDHGEGRRLLDIAVGALRRIGGEYSELGLAAVDAVLARQLRGQGRFDDAARRAKEGLQKVLGEGAGGALDPVSPSLAAGLSLELTLAMLDGGHPETVREAARAVMNWATRPGSVISVVRLRLVLAQRVYLPFGDLDVASTAVSWVAEVIRPYDLPEIEARCHVVQADLAERRGELPEALAATRRAQEAERRAFVQAEQAEEVLTRAAAGRPLPGRAVPPREGRPVERSGNAPRPGGARAERPGVPREADRQRGDRPGERSGPVPGPERLRGERSELGRGSERPRGEGSAERSVPVSGSDRLREERAELAREPDRSRGERPAERSGTVPRPEWVRGERPEHGREPDWPKGEGLVERPGPVSAPERLHGERSEPGRESDWPKGARSVPVAGPDRLRGERLGAAEEPGWAWDERPVERSGPVPRPERLRPERPGAAREPDRSRGEWTRAERPGGERPVERTHPPFEPVGSLEAPTVSFRADQRVPEQTPDPEPGTLDFPKLTVRELAVELGKLATPSGQPPHLVLLDISVPGDRSSDVGTDLVLDRITEHTREWLPWGGRVYRLGERSVAVGLPEPDPGTVAGWVRSLSEELSERWPVFSAELPGAGFRIGVRQLDGGHAIAGHIRALSRPPAEPQPQPQPQPQPARQVPEAAWPSGRRRKPEPEPEPAPAPWSPDPVESFGGGRHQAAEEAASARPWMNAEPGSGGRRRRDDPEPEAPVPHTNGVGSTHPALRAGLFDDGPAPDTWTSWGEVRENGVARPTLPGWDRAPETLDEADFAAEPLEVPEMPEPPEVPEPPEPVEPPAQRVPEDTAPVEPAPAEPAPAPRPVSELSFAELLAGALAAYREA